MTQSNKNNIHKNKTKKNKTKKNKTKKNKNIYKGGGIAYTLGVETADILANPTLLLKKGLRFITLPINPEFWTGIYTISMKIIDKPVSLSSRTQKAYNLGSQYRQQIAEKMNSLQALTRKKVLDTKLNLTKLKPKLDDVKKRATTKTAALKNISNTTLKKK